MKRFILSFFVLFFVHSLLADNPLWLRYPAISPDGEQVVFSYKGDLYKVNASGGTAIPLTMHDGHDFRPVWSHDGRQIAFASHRYGNYDIFIIPAEGGDEEQITFHSADDFPTDFTPGNSGVVFESARKDDASNRQFPSGRLPELYQVPAEGGRVEQMLTTPARLARFNNDGSLMVYHDQKGYEDKFRKHHQSSVTRDIWSYSPENGSFSMLSDFKGEDRNPVFAPEQDAVFYLSEESGDFNIHKMRLDEAPENTQITNFEHHPVRQLSISEDGRLCFSWDGELYTMEEGDEAPEKLDIDIATGKRFNAKVIKPANKEVTEMAVSADGKQVVYIYRGEVFVSAADGKFTRRITNTPEQERSVSFGPEGRKLLYAAERNKSWNIYETQIASADESYFFNATLLEEKPVIKNGKETFQPAYSPDGKEIAYLEERTTLKVYNPEKNETRLIMPGDMSYSYSDGDQHYQWSPDGEWFLVNFYPPNQWAYDAGIVKADGSGEIRNITESGYADNRPVWMLKGDMMIWLSDRHGMRSHGSMGAESDVYGMFFNQQAWDRFNLTEDEFKLLQEQEEEDKKNGGEDEGEKDDEVQPLTIEWEGLEDRKARLTLHSSQISDAVVGKKGSKLYYLARVDDKYDIWETNMRTKKTGVLVKLGSKSGGELAMGPKGKKLFVRNQGKLFTVEIESGKKKPVAMQGEMELKPAQERAYLFEHIWRQVVKKFYVKDLQGVDWDFYKKEYAKFLPYINNNQDFSEMLSELLGELNASHTGARYYSRDKGGNKTAALGVFFNSSHEGDGLLIEEIMDKSPLNKADTRVEAGHIIEKIDGTTITAGMNYYPLLNRKAGKQTRLSILNPESGERWDEVVKPVSRGQESQMLYERWVKRNEKRTAELSDGKLGYVHIRGMNDNSFRDVYEKVIGRYSDKEALVVDTRFNGGGWLHDDLVTLLGGKTYAHLQPRGQHLASEPLNKWTKPSAVIMGEGNYSDAHMFPYSYKKLGIGKLIGMPVPGTSTAVWWERLQDRTLVFGIPQVGITNLDGEYLENQELQPDIRVKNMPGEVAENQDAQLQKAVDELLEAEE